MDERSSSSSSSASPFTTEDEIRDENLVGRILARKTAKKKKNRHNNNPNGMMGGIFEEEPTDIVCAVVCDGWNEGSYAYLTCLRNAEDCAQRKVDAAAIDVKISKDVVAAWEAAVTAASKEADAARLATNNAAYAADTANKYAINTKATAEAFAECSAFEACAELEGACCPDKEGEFLSCCSEEVPPASAECSAYEACAGLDGACCPDKEGEFLSCCSDESPPAPDEVEVDVVVVVEEDAPITPSFNITAAYDFIGESGPACAAYTMCENLVENCCPTEKGVMLDCCYGNPPDPVV